MNACPKIWRCSRSERHPKLKLDVEEAEDFTRNNAWGKDVPCAICLFPLPSHKYSLCDKQDHHVHGKDVFRVKLGVKDRITVAFANEAIELNDSKQGS